MLDIYDQAKIEPSKSIVNIDIQIVSSSVSLRYRIVIFSCEPCRCSPAFSGAEDFVWVRWRSLLYASHHQPAPEDHLHEPLPQPHRHLWSSAKGAASPAYTADSTKVFCARAIPCGWSVVITVIWWCWCWWRSYNLKKFIDRVFILLTACKLPWWCLFSMLDGCEKYGVCLESSLGLVSQMSTTFI